MRYHAKLSLALAGALFGLLPGAARAQQGTTITGRVTTETDMPLQGASVSIASLGLGAYTNAEGRYSFTISAGRAGGLVTITARRIGYTPKSVRVTLGPGDLVQDFQLAAQPTQLEGVVVSALGVQREKSQLGTSQQQIGTTELNQTKAMSVVQQIQGKVSGVQITGSGTQGGSTNIIIRGANSIAGNNQPLFVVDGIPVSNANRGGGLISGFDFGNAIADLNPDDIETFTILKGPNAAAIYGSRAANGVIVITTKKGGATGGRIRTELATTYTWERPSILPDFQNQYGQGAGGNFRYVNGAGKGTCDGCDQSWGPKLDGRPICQFNSPGAGTSNCTATPWVPSPDNVEDFFKTGHTLSSTIAVSGGTDRANARLSVGMDNVDGYTPNNFFQKASGLLSGALQVSPRFNANATLQYIRNNGRNRPGTGYLGSIMEQFFWFGRQIDIDDLRNYQAGGSSNNGPATREFNWNYNYHNNPYWLQEANTVTDARDRFIVSASGTYNITPWANATLRSGSDIYRLNIDQRIAQGNLTYADQNYAGGFDFTNDYRNENNTDLLFTGNKNVLSSLNVNAMVGAGMRREYFSTNSQSTAGLTVPGIYTVANAAITPTLSQQIRRRNVNSAFGSIAFTLNNWWTVEGTARNDWSSTLPKGKNSYFYPSVNTSVILTDALPSLRSGNILSFAKIRGSVARVGNDAEPYQLQTTFIGNPNKFGSLPQFTLNDTLANFDLKPEITQSFETGLELGFFEGRASLDATYYSKETRNQIFAVTVSSTSGFARQSINAGKITNKGFEALLTLVPVQLSNSFQWTTTFNMAQNRNRVAELAPDVNTIILGRGIFGDSRLEARLGQPYGAVYGQGFARDDQGRVLTHNGLPVPADTFTYMGSIQPDWTGGWSNQFSYKNFSLNVLFDIRRGGKIVSYTNEVGDYSGVLASSLKGREIDWNQPGYVFQGIDDVTGQPNSVVLTAEKYQQSIFPTIEPYVYDASYVKLRELRFGFDLPARWANRLYAQNVNLALTGRNLVTWTDVPNVDPEFAYSSGNFQGIEYAIPANARTFGISVRVTP